MLSILLAFNILSIFVESTIYSQEVDSGIEEPTKEDIERKKLLKELDNLIKVAKEAGFTEQEIKQITIERDGETINVWEFIQEEEKRQKSASKKKVKFQKRYLSVRDIAKDLTKKEPKRLDELRKKLILSGEKQK